MTIEQRIIAELDRLNNADPTLHSKALTLHTAVEKIIHQLKAHLGEISTQMKEYDKHDASHSEKVLENIEKLLRDSGIERLSLLEAMTLRLCCYFHDSGMILPECYLPLLEDIERDPRAELPDDLLPWLEENRKTYDVIQDQFYCPDSEEGYEEFLTDEMDRYQKYRLGLPEDISGETHFHRTRHDYLRRTHGERAKRYAKNLIRFLEGIPYGGRSDLAEAVGMICASHCQEITEVRKLETCLELIDSCPDMACNVRYLAMLLRLGDVIHFSSDRASRTVYAERAAMDADSEIHWKTKFEELEYAIRPKEKGVSISYSGCFEDPKAYYFLQSHLDRVDEELRNYAAFVSDMHDEPDADRYSLGLPTNVVRDAIRASRFTPDPELKFRLEHRKIITLLMGMRLYRDEFMCLRELYQNALDACRCMRAENQQKGLSGELKIEFGLSSDRDGDYLYCKDEGTGMTMDIVKNYLLRIGNSYYQSDEFRRSNAQWGDAVAPVSEFGIGLLSCYMIASRIEVITRHHTLPGTPPIWVCMEDSDDYGYFRTPGRTQEKQVGLHGTYVKLYLKGEFKEKVTGYLPECPEDAIYSLEILWKKILDIKGDIEESYEFLSAHTGVSVETIKELELYHDSLYHQVQKFIHIPEEGIPVFLCGDNGTRCQLINSLTPYILRDKLKMLHDQGFGYAELLQTGSMLNADVLRVMTMFRDNVVNVSQHWLDQLAVRKCMVHDPSTNASACTVLHFPASDNFDVPALLNQQIDQFVAGKRQTSKEFCYVDGIPASYSSSSYWLRGAGFEENGVSFIFSGKIRPSLTVDRESIRNMSLATIELGKRLRQMLAEEIARQVEAHFREHPSWATPEALRYENMYLNRKYSSELYYNIAKSLASGVCQDLPLCGITMQDLIFSEHLTFPIFPSFRDGSYEYSLLYTVLEKASRITVDGQCVSLEQTITQGWEWLTWESENRFHSGTIATDVWTGIYEQYDAVDTLLPLVSPHIRDIWPGADLDTHALMFDERHSGVYLKEMLDICVLPDKDHYVDSSVSDILLQLQETPEHRQIHNLHRSPHSPNLSKRYVIYCYLAPKKLTQEQENFVARFDHIPKYREGVEKGWSILFYNYKDGYVIAPGIVDRMEMLKLLPDEALNHDDGLEYYFTDGTRAF